MYLSSDDPAKYWENMKPVDGSVELGRMSTVDVDGYPCEVWAGVWYAYTDEQGGAIRDVYTSVNVSDDEGTLTTYRVDVDELGTSGECAAFVSLFAALSPRLRALSFEPTQIAALVGRVVDAVVSKEVAR